MKKKIIFWLLSFLLFLIYATINGCNKEDEEVKSNIIFNPSVNYGTLKDQDGYTYKTVTIGTQTWMAENLKTTKYNDGEKIPNVTDNTKWCNLSSSMYTGMGTGAYCNYDNLKSNGLNYGRLYNWFAVNTGKLAPKGWHIPSDEEWTILENYLIFNGYNYDGTNTENKIAKSLASNSSWELSDKKGTVGNCPENNNSSGFTALPGGYRFDSYSLNNISFGGIGIHTIWWSSTKAGTGTAYDRGMSNKFSHLYNDDSKRGFGMSVRCIKDSIN